MGVKILKKINLQKITSFLKSADFKLLIIILSILAFFIIYHLARVSNLNNKLNNKIESLMNENSSLEAKIKNINFELTKLKNQDQYKINQDLKKKIKDIEDSYKSALLSYERILDLRSQKVKTINLENQFAKILNYLSILNYSSASAELKLLLENIKREKDNLLAVQATSFIDTPVNNTAPHSGFSQQKVSTEKGEFLISIIAADLNSTRVIVDTASDSDCRDNCPVLPLATYVARNGGFAGINGSYFCPSDYPSCAGKMNSFDTLLMNKNKVYFNSENNIYSNVPLVFFTGNTMGVRSRSSDWGRDTGVDSVIAMQTLLVSNGNPTSAIGEKGAKTFIGSKGNTVYIGVVYNASFQEAGFVLKTLGIENALNLDQGGSTALWYEGYKAGPGRNLPNAIVLVRK